MKSFIKVSAILGVAAMLVLACTKPAPAPTPDPEPTPAEKPVADFTSAVDGLTVTFTNASKNATSYKWDFGDGETSKEASPKHEYASAGEYTVSLTAANADGATAKKEAKVTVAGKPQAYFTYTALEGRDGKYGKVIEFDATGSQNAESITWDFGDGTTATEFTVKHEFPEFGKYTVKATVKGLLGDTSEYSEEVEAVAKNELLKGCGFEEDDAQYWTFQTSVNPDWFGADQFPGLDSWIPEFGYSKDKPAAGEGACFRANGERQLTQAAFNFTVYQAVELSAGDVVKLGLDLKWGENSCNDGLFWIGICNNLDAVKGETQDTAADTETHIVEMFNYWAAAATADWGDGGPSVPAYDGNLEGTEDWIKANEELALGYSGAESTEFTVETGGTYYFFVNYRNVWGNYWGVDVLLDNASLKIIL